MAPPGECYYKIYNTLIMLQGYLWVILLHCERYIFHRGVWYRALSLHCPCIRRPGIILIP